jgi:hypothetical protein
MARLDIAHAEFILVAMEAGLEVGSIPGRRPYHGTVFVLAELPELVETYAVPSPSWGPEDQVASRKRSSRFNSGPTIRSARYLSH